MIRISVKSFLERHYCEISINSLENKVTFMKKAVLYTTTLMHCKVRQILRDLFSTDQVNALKMTSVAGAIKINLKNLKN